MEVKTFESFLSGWRCLPLGEWELDPWPIGTVFGFMGDGCVYKHKTWGVGSRQSFRSAGGPSSLIECP